MAKSESTSKKVASAASKVLRSKTATRAEKAVAGAALTQRSSSETTSAKVATSAAKVLRSKTASKEAKAAAASALTQKVKAVRVSAESDRILRQSATRFKTALKNLANR